jgi:hypothetical protein
MITSCLCSEAHGTLFASYAERDEDKCLRLNPHQLRHLQNSELFRLGVADTIITKRFNRRSVTQSYEYDHRSLTEELEQIALPQEVEIRLGEKASTVARMIRGGKANGPIIDAYRRIERLQGEDAALDYLKTEVDGFHSTPYGHCLSSFTVDPCPKHLECFDGCRHLSATDLPENRRNLARLEKKLEAALQAVQAKKSGSVGRENQLIHAQVRLEAVRKLQATPAGELVFPAGPDLSRPDSGSRKSVLGCRDAPRT